MGGAVVLRHPHKNWILLFLVPQVDRLRTYPCALTRQSFHLHNTGCALSIMSHDVAEWVQTLQAFSHNAIAILHPITLDIEWANDGFFKLIGLNHDSLSAPHHSEPLNRESAPLQDSDPELKHSNPHAQEHSGSQTNSTQCQPSESLWKHLHEDDQQAIHHLYQHHVLYRLLQRLYSQPLPPWRILDEPLMVSVEAPHTLNPLYIQLWIRSEALAFDGMNPLNCLQALGLESVDPQQCMILLNDPNQLHHIEKRLSTLSISLSGRVLLEGIDITTHEQMRHITQLLVDQNSVLQPERFEVVNTHMCLMFRADTTAIVCLQRQMARLFMGDVSNELNVANYSFDELKGGQMMEAIANQTVMTVPDLSKRCVTELGERLLSMGVRSLLLLPLMAEQVTCGHRTRHPIGLVGMLSNVPNHFDSVDRRRAEQLVPAFTAALTTALRQMHHKQFINSIHPSVEWRFIQEAERRSLGMLPEPIIFHGVFPLYGISDIRGSSQERNRAIQIDLLTQLRLGLAVVDAVCEKQSGAFVTQLRLDMLDKIVELEQGVTVGAEVTISRYLHDRLEAHFDHFATFSSQVKTKVEAYRNACQTKQGGVYNARAHYDFVLSQINSRLRTTWEQWQEKMQRIIPHYCDVEVTDGIDHMIYAGEAIAVDFSPFHLRSLRYEQLRAVCASARTAFDIQAEFNSTLEVTHLVLVQDSTVDIFHDEDTERLFDVQGTRDTRYEIVKKRIDKAIDASDQTRITQPGMLTIVYSTEQEETEYSEYVRYLIREGWVDQDIQSGQVEPLQGVSGLKFMRVSVLPNEAN